MLKATMCMGFVCDIVPFSLNKSSGCNQCNFSSGSLEDLSAESLEELLKMIDRLWVSPDRPRLIYRDAVVVNRVEASQTTSVKSKLVIKG